MVRIVNILRSSVLVKRLKDFPCIWVTEIFDAVASKIPRPRLVRFCCCKNMAPPRASRKGEAQASPFRIVARLTGAGQALRKCRRIFFRLTTILRLILLNG